MSHEIDEDDTIKQSKTKKTVLSNVTGDRHLSRTLDISMYHQILLGEFLFGAND